MEMPMPTEAHRRLHALVGGQHTDAPLGQPAGDRALRLSVRRRAHYHFRIESSFDGGTTFATLMEGTYRKK
jgi:hypothetical protein